MAERPNLQDLLRAKTEELTEIGKLRDLARKAMKHLREIGLEVSRSEKKEYADHIEIPLEHIWWNVGRTQYSVCATLWVGKNGKAARVDPNSISIPFRREDLSTSIEQDALHAAFKELRGFVPFYELVPDRAFLRVAIVHEDVIRDLKDGFGAHLRFEGF